MPEFEREETYDAVEKAANVPSREREHQRLMSMIDKHFQTKILIILVCTIGVLILANAGYVWLGADPILMPVLQIVTPVFTFLLGMGTRTTPAP